MEENIRNISLETEPSGGKKMMSKILPILLIVLAICGGIFTGYKFVAKKGGSTGMTGVVPKSEIVKGKEFGTEDASVFKDTAIGVVEKGGIDGEGTHKLLREGGSSQNVYLTSSVLDLDQFIGEKIQVWGETMKAQKAGWLMDVGKIKILE